MITEGAEKGSVVERNGQSQQIKGKPEGVGHPGWAPQPGLGPLPGLAAHSGAGMHRWPGKAQAAAPGLLLSSRPSSLPGCPFCLFNSIQLGLPARKLVSSDIQLN